MKKLLYCAAALAMAFFAGSCQQENLEPVVNGSVTYTITLPETVQTKGSSGYTEGYDLYYEVYKTADFAELENATVLFDNFRNPIEIDGSTRKVDVPFDLLNDQDYTILFWANKKGANCFELDDLRSVGIKDSASNNNDRDAFCTMDQLENVNGSITKTVTLTRPFAQLNIATEIPEVDYDVIPDYSYVKVTKVPTVYNVATGAATNDAVVEFKTAAVPVDKKITVDSKEYNLVAMNYVLVPEGNINVYYAIETANGVVTNTINNVPVKKNYRTNIVGNLLTSNATYTVDLQPGFDGGDGEAHVEVINEGVIKNINGDYEVSNAKGLAYAINNLMADGGDFYLTAAEYDMTGLNVNPVTINSGKTLNIYGETPVVTRAMTSIAGITIKGLDSIIETIPDDANVSISGVKLVDEGSVLVETNNGTLVVSESTGEEAIVSGGSNKPVEADNVKDLPSLNAALASAVKTIEIAADIVADEVIYINRSVVINANDYKIITSANRIIGLMKNDIEVVINNLNAVSSTAVKYPSDVRGFNINSYLSNVNLTLNNCTIDFTDITTNDWTYPINVAGYGTGHKLTIIGGSYEGANVVNVHGAKNIVTIDGAKLTSLYPDHSKYYGACIYVPWYSQTEVTLVHSELNGNNAVAINGCEEGKGNTLVEENNTYNVVRNNIVDGINTYYVSSLEKLNQSIANAKNGDNLIYFLADIAGDVTVAQKQGVKITIDGCDYKYNGTIKVHSNSNHYADAALTIKNVNFETSTVYYDSTNDPYFNFIEALENGSKRYSTNITVDQCTFTATGAAVNETVALQIKASKNAKALNCTAKGLHSLVQAQSCDETVVVNGCTINGKNGVAFKQVKAATVEGTTINALEYGIRFDGNTDNYGIIVKDNDVTAKQPLIIRKMTGKDNTITLEGTNTLTTENGYQVVITKGSDDEAYVAPTGTYTLTGADNMFVYPRDVVATTAAELKAALKAAKTGDTINILADITISENWDARNTGGKTIVPVVIDGHGHTLKFINTIDDKNYFSVFRFENDAVVRNLNFDLSEALGTSNRFRAISAKSNLTVDKCKFIGNPSVTNTRAIIFGEGQSNQYDALVSITNSTFENWRRGVTDNENNTDIRRLIIEGNTFTNANVGISAYEYIKFCGNTTDLDVSIMSYTYSASAKVDATGNSMNAACDNTIGSKVYMFSAANVNAQEEFTLYVE